ncbi:phosphatidate cytidylyltransferase [Anaerosoma tenue]|uniref:phosphatidate cytidylyltransferase n=1 Tax=Anaerosoma tenue TaxID=2933588 RepID=UPI002260FFAA|nr:phosphatidate cytidylyltransferase [Anaerosoma tenue]MCK8114216.1 phosphatidate cytidylyltransferase [Anaerosoma tenue]
MTVSLRDLWIRTGSALALGVVMLAALFFGGVWGLAAVVAVIAALACIELFAMSRRERRMPNEVVALTAVVAMPFAAAWHGSTGLTAVVAALVISAFFWHVLIRQIRLADTSITVFGAVYVGFTLSHLILIREMEAGTLLALTTIVSVWANDVFAYLAGSAFGRHPLAPRISPKKSWEGLVAGTLGTIVTWVAAGALLDLPVAPVWLAVVGALASVAAVIGDLAESRIKREVRVKDSGTLLPGHGGFLDRFDSFIMVAIVTYYALFVAGVR